MTFRSNYWSCSKFADWLRGTPKLEVGTGKEWRLWRKAAKDTHPVRYWIVEEGLDYLQNFVNWPADRFHDFRYYINNRWVSHSHRLTAHPRDIKPGTWCDVGNRFLPCLFNELVDFVEIEQAWHHCLWSDEESKKYKVPWWRRNFLRWRTWRCPEAGLEYLRWAMTLTDEEFLDEDQKHLAQPTYQAKAAKEILELYTWWKEVYPQRPDPHDAGGWSDYCQMRRDKGYDLLDMEDKSPEDAEMCRKTLDKTREIEEAYEAENEAMMIRLIKIRQSLWT
jgi:hypothetical protein